jgi:hypothetical protein
MTLVARQYSRNLLVQKMWRLAYRFNGKQKTLALGHYSEVSLLTIILM